MLIVTTLNDLTERAALSERRWLSMCNLLPLIAEACA